jgi:hypothetical protein
MVPGLAGVPAWKIPSPSLGNNCKFLVAIMRCSCGIGDRIRRFSLPLQATADSRPSHTASHNTVCRARRHASLLFELAQLGNRQGALFVDEQRSGSSMVRSSGPLKFRQAVRRIARLSVAALTTLFQPTVSDLETARQSSIRARACYPNGHVHASELVVSSQRAPRAGVRACKRLFRCLTLSGIRGGLAFDPIWTSRFQSKPVWRQPSLRLVEPLP